MARAWFPAGAFLQASREAESCSGGTGARGFVAPSTSPISSPASAPSPSLWRATPRSMPMRETRRRLPRLPRPRAKHLELKPVRGFVRDLFRAPLGPKELKAYDAVVFDPPRAGAAAQAESLAKSEVPRLVAVSCNPGTFARDLRILVDGGYRIARVGPGRSVPVLAACRSDRPSCAVDGPSPCRSERGGGDSGRPARWRPSPRRSALP